MAHIAELANYRSVGHLELLDHRGESRCDGVDDDAVLGALLSGREERCLGSAIRARVPATRRCPSQGLGGDPPTASGEQELWCRTDEAVDGERGTRRMKRTQASEEVGLAKRSVRVHRHLTSQDDLVEASAGDFGQRGGDPIQEVLVRSG